MKIVLDTSALILDPWLRSPTWQAARALAAMNYSTVNAEFVLPEVVRLELPAALMRKWGGKEVKEARRVVPDVPSDEDLLERHNKLVNQNFVVSPVGAITAAHARQSVMRAVARRPPCDQNGEQLRDSLVWEAVLSIAASEPDKTVFFFVSDRIFWSGKKGPAASDLLQDARDRGVVVHFFRGTPDFIERNNEAVAFVTESWIVEKLGERLKNEATTMFDGVLRSFLEPYPPPLRMKYEGDIAFETERMQIRSRHSIALPDRTVALAVGTVWPATVTWELEEPIGLLPDGAPRVDLIQQDGRTLARARAELIFRNETVVSEEVGNVVPVWTDGYVQFSGM